MKIHSSNYYNTLITTAADCKATEALVPPVKEGKQTIANLQYDLLREKEGQITSDDLLFELHAVRKDLLEEEWPEEREKFFSKGQACLRASPLCKTYGWAIFHDSEGKIQLLDPASSKYAELMADGEVKKIAAMRSSKA